MPNLDCCHAAPPFTPTCRACTDLGCRGVRFFSQTRRDCFWPIFSHPQWLCCRILYCCRGRR